MSDVSQIKQGDDVFDIKDATARSTKVDKAGDTMTGNLAMQDGARLIVDVPNLDGETNPAADIQQDFLLTRDENGNAMVKFSQNFTDDGDLELGLIMRHYSYNSDEARDEWQTFIPLGIKISRLGVLTYQFPIEFLSGLGMDGPLGLPVYWPVDKGGTGATSVKDALPKWGVETFQLSNGYTHMCVMKGNVGLLYFRRDTAYGVGLLTYWDATPITIAGTLPTILKYANTGTFQVTQDVHANAVAFTLLNFENTYSNS